MTPAEQRISSDLNRALDVVLPVAKHTPGPWRFSDANQGTKRPLWEYITSDCGPICTVNQTGEADMEDAANARLIAAAPDLLAACKALIKDVSVPSSDHPWAINRREAHALAISAIAKAEVQS